MRRKQFVVALSVILVFALTGCTVESHVISNPKSPPVGVDTVEDADETVFKLHEIYNDVQADGEVTDEDIDTFLTEAEKMGAYIEDVLPLLSALHDAQDTQEDKEEEKPDKE